MGKSRFVVLAIGTAVLVSLTAFVPVDHREMASAVAALGSISPVNLAFSLKHSHQISEPVCSDNGDYTYNPDYTNITAAFWGCLECEKAAFIQALVPALVMTWAKVVCGRCLVGLLLWFVVVSNYPVVDRHGDNDKRAGGEVLQVGIMDCCSCYKGTASNCVWSLYCPHARAAATMHSTGTMNYFLACLCMLTPFASFVLCYVSLFTDMWEKLGGNIPDCCSATFQSFCCMPCKVAREASALDAVQGMETTLCGVARKVSNDYRQYP